MGVPPAGEHVAIEGEVVIDDMEMARCGEVVEWLGVLLVTIWQSVAQVEVAYGRQADTILTNHLSKVFYAGLSDPASLRYITTVLGDAEVETRSRSTSQRPAAESSQYATTRVALAPAHVLRQMRPGDALLLHGTLPPAHIRTRPFYDDRHLATRAARV
jgi:type IV secretion system protein VirD4